MIALVVAAALATAPAHVHEFRVVALGAEGGLEDGDLSAYLAEVPGKAPLLLDAGTVVHGLEVAQAKGALGAADVDKALARIGAVLISHAHFDHIAGLVIASPDDHPRPLLALPSTIDALRDHVFNGVVWANFGSEGIAPVLNRYSYVRLMPGTSVRVDSAGVDVTAFPLSHAGTISTAFILDAGDSAIVYCGDTGADDVEKSDALAVLFSHLAPMVRGHKLAAIFLESSYPSDHADAMLFGHLTPKHLLAELHVLASAVDLQHPDKALAGINVVVTHMKPALSGSVHPREAIIDELTKKNDLGVRFVFPKQGDVLLLSPP